MRHMIKEKDIQGKEFVEFDVSVLEVIEGENTGYSFGGCTLRIVSDGRTLYAFAILDEAGDIPERIPAIPKR
jgi:hypothetical protein